MSKCFITVILEGWLLVFMPLGNTRFIAMELGFQAPFKVVGAVVGVLKEQSAIVTTLHFAALRAHNLARNAQSAVGIAHPCHARIYRRRSEEHTSELQSRQY